MAQIDPQKFYKDLESTTLSPVIFIYGEEPYLLNQALERIKLKVLSEGASDFNFDLFYATDSDVSRIVDAVETLPMMAAQRLVILKEAQDLTDSEWRQLEKLFNTPVESTVFVISASVFDKRKKALKTLLNSGYCVEFKKPFENQIPRWIHYIAQTIGVQISDSGAALLHRLVGHQLTEIESELKKLADYVGADQKIEVSDVSKIVSRAKEENVFDFIKSVGEGDRILALDQLNQLIQQGQSEVGIVSLVARHLRILLKIRKGQEAGLRGVKLAHYAQVPPFFLESYMSQTDQWSREKLHKTLVLLSHSDKALKSSALPSKLVLEDLIFAIFRT